MFNARMELPAGLSAAPYTAEALDAVFAVAAEQQQHDIGRVDVETADFEADWQRPSFDFATMTMGVYDGDRIVAFAELIGAGRGEAGVLPEYRRRGIGTALARWLEGAAREHGYPAIGGPVPQGSDGDRLLEKLGYRVRWTSWVLALPEGTTIPGAPAPGGLRDPRRDAGRLRGGLERRRGRLPRVVGARPRVLRGLPRRDRTPPRPRAVDAAGRHRPGRRGGRHRDAGDGRRARGRGVHRAARRPQGPARAGDWARRCSSTPSTRAGSTARRGPGSRPTPAPAR